MTPPRLVILVEGGADRYFIKYFVEKSRKEQRLSILLADEDIEGGGGFEGLLKLAKDKVEFETDYDALGVVCDLDGKAGQKNWTKLTKAFPGVALPEYPPAEGTIVPIPGTTSDTWPTQPRHLGIWLMPDNQTQGDLETFLERIRSTDGDQGTLWNRANDTVNELPARLFKPKDELKAKLCTWLAWQKEPGASYGLAVSLGAFNLQHPNAMAFVNWLERLRSTDNPIK